jgi:hypothetical protein
MCGANAWEANAWEANAWEAKPKFIELRLAFKGTL